MAPRHGGSRHGCRHAGNPAFPTQTAASLSRVGARCRSGRSIDPSTRGARRTTRRSCSVRLCHAAGTSGSAASLEAEGSGEAQMAPAEAHPRPVLHCVLLPSRSTKVGREPTARCLPTPYNTARAMVKPFCLDFTSPFWEIARHTATGSRVAIGSGPKDAHCSHSHPDSA